MLRLVDNITGEKMKGSRATILTLVYKRYKEYKCKHILKGIYCIRDTYYIG